VAEKRKLVTEKHKTAFFTSKITCTQYVCTGACGNLLRAGWQTEENIEKKT